MSLLYIGDPYLIIKHGKSKNHTIPVDVLYVLINALYIFLTTVSSFRTILLNPYVYASLLLFTLYRLLQLQTSFFPPYIPYWRGKTT